MASKGPVETYVTRGWVVAGPFGEEDSEENLLFEEEPSNNLPQIRGGTLHKLIERATFDKYPDPEYVHQFLLTYRSFSSPNELLTLLKARLEQPAPSNLREAELAEYNKVERNVLLRIYNFCKIWASNFWYDFMADPELRASFLEWAHTELLAKVPAASQLEKILDRELSRAEALSRALSSELAFTNDAGEMPPKPILPPTKARALGILDFHPLEFARQLTILEFEIYCKIKPWELLGLAWAKPNASSKAPHILDMIQWTNHITAFVASEIITAKGASGKIKTISFFIKVMKHLFDLHNFSGVSAISAGFQHSAVHRLRPYWGEISRAKMTILETISARISTEHNSLALRAELKQTSLPLIPYLGMFLTDLTFMDEGNPDYITLPSGKKLINFSKKRRTSIVIRDILLYQLTPYVLTPIKVIQSYIKNAQTYDDDTLYKISEQTIPRGHNKLTLKELEAAEKTQGAGRQEQLDKEIEAIIGQATENMSFGELEQVPGYPFYDSDRPGENIVFDGELVVAGTLPKLVERLTYTKKPDPRFMEAFIFAWSSFAAPEELIQLLRYRFDVPMPVKANLDTRTKYKQLVVSPTQLRVCNTMKLWLEKCNKDFLVVPGLAAMALQLMEHIADQNPILVATSQKIIDALRQLVDGQEPAGRSNIYDLKENSLLSAPQFAAIDSTAEYPFCVSPSEFAKDLFAYDQQTFSEMLRPVTLLDFLANESKYPKFARFISWPRLLSRWTSSIILHGTSVEQRALRVDYLLQLMQEVKSLRDYHSFVGLQLGTSHGAVLKLEATIGRVDASGLAALPECKELRVQLQNYESQIKLLKAEGNGTPVTPFLPCFVSELQSDFREPKLLSNGLINFQRARGLAQRMSELVSCQNYVFQRTPSDRLLAWAAAIEKVSLSDQQIEQKTSQLLVQEQNELKAGRTSRNDSSGVFNSALRSALLADPAFSSALLKILGDEPATGGASNQALADFRVEMANEIQRVTATCVTGPDDFEELAIQALVERFGDEPAGELCEWAYRDEKGAVYGWPERISLNILTDTSGSTWIVALQPTLNTPALSGLLRKQKFYKETTRQPSVSLFIITCQAHASVLSYIDEATAEIALIRSQFC